MPLQVTLSTGVAKSNRGKKTCLKITAFLIQCVTTVTTPSKLKWINGTLKLFYKETKDITGKEGNIFVSKCSDSAVGKRRPN